MKNQRLLYPRLVVKNATTGRSMLDTCEADFVSNFIEYKRRLIDHGILKGSISSAYDYVINFWEGKFGFATKIDALEQKIFRLIDTRGDLSEQDVKEQVTAFVTEHAALNIHFFNETQTGESSYKKCVKALQEDKKANQYMVEQKRRYGAKLEWMQNNFENLINKKEVKSLQIEPPLELPPIPPLTQKEFKAIFDPLEQKILTLITKISRIFYFKRQFNCYQIRTDWFGNEFHALRANIMTSLMMPPIRITNIARRRLLTNLLPGRINGNYNLKMHKLRLARKKKKKKKKNREGC